MSQIKGFNNIGNNCYLNSGLQMLVQNKDFCKIIMNNRNKTHNLQVMGDFIEEYYNSPSGILNPVKVKQLVASKNHTFRGNNQEDAGEFIIYLLDILNDDLKGELNSIFEIKTETIVKCKILRCLNNSITYEKNNYLILPIEKEDRELDDCYRRFKVHEKLEGDNMYYCEKCKAKRIATRRLNVVGWQNNLIICLKRFINNGHHLMKNNQEIHMPIDWRHDFTIKGAVIHGGGIGGGHYIYLSRDIKNNQWFVCDDSSVNQISEGQAQNMLNRAYIFNYVRKE